MIIVMEANAVPEQIQQVSSKLEEKGFQVHLSQGVERTIIGAIGQMCIRDRCHSYPHSSNENHQQ